MSGFIRFIKAIPFPFWMWLIGFVKGAIFCSLV